MDNRQHPEEYEMDGKRLSPFWRYFWVALGAALLGATVSSVVVHAILALVAM